MAFLSGTSGGRGAARNGGGGAAGTYVNKENSDELYTFVKSRQLTNFTLTTANPRVWTTPKRHLLQDRTNMGLPSSA